MNSEEIGKEIYEEKNYRLYEVVSTHIVTYKSKKFTITVTKSHCPADGNRCRYSSSIIEYDVLSKETMDLYFNEHYKSSGLLPSEEYAFRDALAAIDRRCENYEFYEKKE